VWYDRNADGNTFLHLAVANGHTETARRILELLNGTEEQQLARRALEQQQELKRQKDAEDAKTKEENEKEKKGKEGEEVDITPFSWPPAQVEGGAGAPEKEVKETEKEKKEDEDEEDDMKVKPPPQLLDVNADNMTEETPLHVAAYYGTRDETHNTRHHRTRTRELNFTRARLIAGHSACVELLLKYGASVKAKTTDSKTSSPFPTVPTTRSCRLD
jgi:ankyrin repeat protein